MDVIYSRQELEDMGIKAGDGVKVSRLARFYAQHVEIGDYTRIDDGCILTGHIKLGKRVHLAPYCVLYGKAGIEIGDYSGFGAFNALHSESDDYSGMSMFGPCVPDEYQPQKLRAPIRIGRNVLTGTRVTILPGCHLPDGVAVGAHSLVKGDCQPDAIYAGVPAKWLRERHTDIWALMRNFELGLEP